jgi:two-component system response regulator DegU
MDLNSQQIDPKSQSRKITVLIADDHPIVRTGIRNELQQYHDIEVLAEAENGDDALRLAQSLQPDVLLLDINMPGLRAIDVIKGACGHSEKTKVLVLSAFGDLEYILAMLKAGANGYMLKDEEPSTITKGVRTIARGETWLSSEVASNLVFASIRGEKEIGLSEITSREREVLSLIARGYGNQRISEMLSISEGTVKNHITNIYDKLDFKSRAEAVAWAWQHGLVKSQIEGIGIED